MRTNSKPSNFLGVAIAAAIVAGASPSQAQEQSSQELGKMEVKGQTMGQSMAVELGEYGTQVQIVSSEEIDRGGYTNVAEVIQQTVRGAHIRYSPDEGEFKVHLDGGGDRDTLVLQDGVPLTDRGPALEMIWGTTIIDPHMIERIEVYRGGQSLYYGSESGVGVINIITKQPDGTENGEFGVRYGSFTTREAWGNVSGNLGNGSHSFMFYGSYKHTDTYDMFDEDAYPENMKEAGAQHDLPLTRDNIGMKYYWNIDATSDFRFHAQYTQVNFRDAFPHNTVFAPNYTKYPIVDAKYFKAWSQQLTSDVQLYWRQPMLHNTELYPVIDPETGEWTGNYSHYNNKGFGRNQARGGFTEYGANIQNRYTFDQGSSVLGGFQSVNVSDNSDEQIAIRDETFTVNGFYVDLRPHLSISPSTRISLAARVDTSNEFDNKNTWKFGVRQPIGDSFYARANGGTSYNLPRTTELYVDTETFVSNPDLMPEETDSFGAGVGADTYVGNIGVQAELGLFMTDIDNRIQGIELDNGMNSVHNLERVTEIRGWNLNLGVQPTSQLSFNFNGTFNDAKVEGEDQQIDATPEWMLKASLNWHSADDRFHASLLPRYMGPIYYEVGDTYVNYGEYMVVNGSLGYWAGERNQHRFQFRIVNLLDEEYSERQTGGTLMYDKDYILGNIDSSDPEYRYQYSFNGKARSYYVTYSYSF